MKNHIKASGIELEGYWENRPQEFKHDGSVEINGIDSDCDGSCRDNCECFGYCDCDSCQVCYGCEDSLDECECDSCLRCQGCDNHPDDCNCEHDNTKLDSCENKECKNGDLCDGCQDYRNDEFHDNQEFYRECDIITRCNYECGCECQCECQCEIGGEVASPILDSKEKIKQYILDKYPDEHNDSCGMHNHFSFKGGNKDINLIARPQFHKYLKDRLREFGHKNHINSGSRFWKRLAGQYYCKDEFKPEEQLAGGDRYTHINFCSVRKFGTVEFRLGNIFDKKELSLKYTDELYDIINEWLNTQKVKVYEFEYKFNKNTCVYVRFNMVEDGLKIFVKTFGLEDELKTDLIYVSNGVSLYENHLDFMRLNINENSLFNDDGYCNMSFMRLIGQSSGKSYIIKGVFTDNDLDRFYDSLTSQIPTLIKDIKGIKTICV